MEDKGSRNSWLKALTAVLVGLLGAVIIWVVTPYNNYVIANSFISDSYLPVAALFLLLTLILCINPLLRRVGMAFDKWQLALILGIMIVASVLPGQGLMRGLPYLAARAPMDVSQNKRLANVYEKMNLPPQLFPSKIGFGEKTPESTYFATELPKGESIPWSAWVMPALTWGTFFLFVWLLMVGMAQIVLPQWRQNERLPFPLLAFQQTLIEAPDQGTFWPELFRKKSFWIAAGAVFFIHFLVGMKVYFPDRVPAIPLRWDLRDMVMEEPLSHLPWNITSNRIYFMFLGFAFFMPSRISYSLVFFQLAYAAYIVIGEAYLPPFEDGTIGDHKTGAAIALTLVILWLGRAHWWNVVCSLFRATNDAQRRDRKAALMFLVGGAGMFGWLLWVGVQWYWAIFFIVVTFTVSLLVTRFLAETGMPFFRVDAMYPHELIRMAPLSALGPVSVYFATLITIFIQLGSRVSAAAMATHAIGMDEKATPKQQSRRSFLFIGVLILGFLICGAVHLYINYHHSMSLDGREIPLNPGGAGWIGQAHFEILQWSDGQMTKPVYNRWGHIAFGAILAGLLYWGCLSSPKFPLHPVGLLMVMSYFSNEAWVSVLFGALAKTLFVRYGGARLYRAMVPVFIGLIIGEVFAVAFWALVPAVLVMFDKTYQPVQIQPM